MRSLDPAVAAMSSRILKPDRRQPGRDLVEPVAAHHEKAGHGIGERRAHQPVGQPGRQPRNRAAAFGKAGGAAACDIAGARHQIGLAACEPGQHGGQHFFIMLQIGVDHRDIRRGGGQHAFDAGARQPAPPHPAEAAHPQVVGGRSPSPLRRCRRGNCRPRKWLPRRSRPAPGPAAAPVRRHCPAPCRWARSPTASPSHKCQDWWARQVPGKNIALVTATGFGVKGLAQGVANR